MTGQIYCSTCASNLISGDRLYSSGYIRVCNICLARLEPDGDDATSEIPEHEAPQHALALSWTPSLPSLRRLAVGQRSDPVQDMGPPTQLPPNESFRRSGRQIDYVVHERDLSGNVLGLGDDFPTRPDTPDEIWQDDATTAELDSPVDRSPGPRLGREARAAPAPFRPAFGDDDQPVAKSDDMATYAASVRPEATDDHPTEEDATLVLDETPPDAAVAPATGPVEELDQVTELPIRASPVFPTDLGPESAEPEDSPALMRKRVISRPLLPHLASPTPSASSFLGSDSAQPPPVSSEKRDSVWQEAELTAAAMAHLRLMVRQSLQREDIPHPAIWEKELLRLLAKVSRYPTPNVEGGEPADIRRIVKIKKIPGGTPADSEYVDGIVCTKNVLHKQMPRLVNNPRVVLLGFSLDYERVEGRLTKLETLLNQEKTWLRSNVDKVLKLRPAVVLVEGNVPGYAIELFKEANVAIARNVKSGIVQAVARCAQTAPNTMEKLATRPTYGHCGLYQVQTFAHSLIPGYRKTFMRFEGCPHELGATLVLRGGDVDVLTRIKSIANAMVRVAYSLKLESYYLRDEGAFLGRPGMALADRHANNIRPSLLRGEEAKAGPAPVRTTDLDKTLQVVDAIITPYELVVLSGSPSVQVAPPRPLAQLRDSLQKLDRLQQQRDADEAALIIREEAEAQSRAPSVHELDIGSSPPSPGVSTATLRPVATEEATSVLPALQSPAQLALDSSIADLGLVLPVQAALADSYLAAHTQDLEMAGHQRIVVQESVTRSDGKLCRGSLLREMQFYQPGEQSIGQTIETLVACRSEPCPTKGCGEPKQSHRTHFIHGHFEAVMWIHHQVKGPGAPDEIDATLEPGNESLILMEGFCRDCNGHTVKTKMSDDSWRFSFGKFLELCFHSPGLVTGSVTRRDTGLRIPCTHDAHQDHVRHFFHRGYRVDLTVRKVNVYDVCLPPTRLRVKAEAQLSIRNAEYLAKRRRTASYFDSVRARLAGFNLDLVSAEKQEKCREALATLQRLADADQSSIESQLDQAYKATSGTNGMRMNTIRKALVDKAVAWDTEFSSFEIKFIAPAEKDVRRLTSVQLRRLFSDPSAPTSPDRPLLQYNTTLPTAYEIEGKDQRSPLPSPCSATIQDPLSLQLPSANLTLPDLPSPAPKEDVIGGSPGDVKSPEVGNGAANASPSTNRKEGAADLTSGEPHRQRGTRSITPSISGDRDDAHDSDSTVVDEQERFRRFRVDEERDGHAETHSDASSEYEQAPRHLRGRRTKPSGGMASLVSKFDEVDAAATPVTSQPSPRRSPESPASRPPLKRGKTEATRSTRRPAVSDGPLSDGESSIAKRRSRLPRLASSTLSDRTSSPGNAYATPSPAAANPHEPRPSTRRTNSSTLKRSTSGKPSSISAGSGVERAAGGSPVRARVPLPGLSRSNTATERKGKETARRIRQEGIGTSSGAAPHDSRPDAVTAGGGRVSTIARHFDRITRDAERDRQRRAVLSRGRRARPIAHAQSSVHTFSSLRAAVHEDSDEDDADDEDEPAGVSQKPDGPGAIFPPVPNQGPDGDTTTDSPTSITRSPQIAVLPPAPRQDAQRESESSHGGSPPGPHREGFIASVPPSPVMTSDGFAPSRLAQWSESEFSSSDTSRNSIMKTLSSFWNYRGADFLPLEYPQYVHTPTYALQSFAYYASSLATEHQSAENPVVIREDEPTSIVAYTLW